MSLILWKSIDTNKELMDFANTLNLKVFSELRVQNLELLNKEMYWLAWTLSDSVHEKFEDDSKLMLKNEFSLCEEEASGGR